jgi:ATP/maltotriose-dependent transcriptional regulator MalT
VIPTSNDVRRAYELAIRAAGVEDLSREVAKSASPRDAATLLLKGVVAQYRGNVERCIELLQRALAAAAPGERAYVVDLLAPVHLMQGDVRAAAELLDGLDEADVPRELEGPCASLRAIVLARSDEEDEARALCAEADRRSRGGEFSRARVLQRISTAFYYICDFELAAEAAKKSASVFGRLGAHRAAAAALSVAYNIQHAYIGDVEETYRLAKAMTHEAELAHDRSFAVGALVAQYELAAELGDAATVSQLAVAIRKEALPELYRERFARGLADTLPYAWTSDFTAFKANAVLLRDASANGRAAIALASALRSLAEAALGDVPEARRSSRNAIAVASLHARGEAAFDVRYRRIARALAAATCIMIGDSVRGQRSVGGRSLRNDADVQAIVRVAAGADWRTAGRRVRGYARVVAAVRASLADSIDSPLTHAETEILGFLADGMSAPQIALELGRSVHTVRAHTRAIIAKFNVSGRGAAISHARRIGLVS